MVLLYNHSNTENIDNFSLFLLSFRRDLKFSQTKSNNIGILQRQETALGLHDFIFVLLVIFEKL